MYLDHVMGLCLYGTVEFSEDRISVDSDRTLYVLFCLLQHGYVKKMMLNYSPVTRLETLFIAGPI